MEPFQYFFLKTEKDYNKKEWTLEIIQGPLFFGIENIWGYLDSMQIPEESHFLKENGEANPKDLPFLLSKRPNKVWTRIFSLTYKL